LTVKGDRWVITDEHIDFDSLILSGGHMLGRNPARAFAMFNKACTLIKSVLQHQSPIVMAWLLQTFSFYSWTGHEKVKHVLLQHLNAVATDVLDKSHPVRCLLKIMLGDLGLASLSRAIVLMVVDSNSSSNISDDPNILRSELDCFIGLDAGSCDTSVRAALARLQELGRLNLPEDDDFHEQALVADIRLDRKMGNLEEAERKCLALIQTSLDDTGRKNGTYLGLESCSELGYPYYIQDRLEEAEEYIRLAIEGEIEMYGEDNAYIIYTLELILKRSGKDDELEQLRHDYAGIYAAIEKYTLRSDAVEEIDDSH
jgi:tetratricopeptide (TPR) repeat protein